MASFQYVAETSAGKAQPGPRRRKKWIAVVAGVAGAGVLGGVLAGRSGASAPSTASTAPALTIGTPTISVGKP